MPLVRTPRADPARLGLCAALLPALLLGCGNAARTDPVSSEKSKAVLRSDDFQAAAATPRALVVVGARGAILASADGGKTWTRQVMPGPSSLIAAAACPDGSFVALDFYRKVWVGDPSGKNWTSRELKTKSDPLALACDPRGRYWVVGSYSTILAGQDQGASWKETALGEDLMFTTVQFLDRDHGVITGEFGSFLATADGGATWRKGKGIPNDFYPYAALFTDLRTGWVAGLAGAILHTADGGQTWTRQPNMTGVLVYGLVRHGGGMFAVGNNGQMLRLRDGRWVACCAHGKTALSYLRAAVSVDHERMLIAGGSGSLHVMFHGAAEGGAARSADGAVSAHPARQRD